MANTNLTTKPQPAKRPQSYYSTDQETLPNVRPDIPFITNAAVNIPHPRAQPIRTMMAESAYVPQRPLNQPEVKNGNMDFNFLESNTSGMPSAASSVIQVKAQAPPRKGQAMNNKGNDDLFDLF
jgi:hypothetical protein